MGRKKSKIEETESIGKALVERNKEHKCDVCGETFSSKALLAVHVSNPNHKKSKAKPKTPTITAKTVSKAVKIKTPYRCWVPKCKVRTVTEKELLVHYKAKHPKVKIKKLKGGGFEPVIGDVRVSTKRPKAGRIEKETKPKKSKKAVKTPKGRKDRGDWYNARTGMQLWLLNDSEELAFLDEAVKAEGSGGRPGVLLKALQGYMKKKR